MTQGSKFQLARISHENLFMCMMCSGPVSKYGPTYIPFNWFDIFTITLSNDPSTNMFVGFISLYMMFLECRYWSPRHA